MADETIWTPEQARAIKFRGGAAIVSAAAGSGKTAVLVERVKQMIMDEKNPMNADEMVISTFTQKAAGEIKERLANAIEKELQKAPDNEYLIKQRLRLEDAHISTISSFCLDILRRNSAAADMQPGFSVLDESEATMIFSQSMSELLEEFCEEGDTAERELLYDWFAEETDEGVVKAVDYFYRFSCKLVDADSYFAAQLGMYSDTSDDNPAEKAIADRYTAAVVCGNIRRFGQLADEFSAKAAGTRAEDCAKGWQDIRSALEEITDTESCNTKYAALCALTPPTLPRGSKNFNSEPFKEPHADMKELLEGIVHSAGLIARRNADLRECAPVLGILAKLAKRLGEIYSAKKREKGRVDFDDIELMTLKLLRGADGKPTEIARETAKGIKTIIVDEFQDSNEIQYEIFRLISDNKRNLFFVGDVKQCIYYFRGAEPSVFVRLTKDPDFTVIELNRNFRSNGAVIDAVNGIFTGLMTEELGGVDYDESCALVQGAAYDVREEDKAELHQFKTKNVEQSRIAEAAYIADRINSMIRSGYTVNDSGKRRPCEYNDFAVIMGSYSSFIDIYREAFDKAGIPYDAKEAGGYTDAAEIAHALSLLKVIDDPYRDADLAAVLMREPYKFSVDEMAEIKLAGNRKRLWTGLRELAKTDEHARTVLYEINGYREFAAENSAERLIRKICDESMLIPAAEAAPDGIKRSANLRMLTYYAEMFSGGESANLYDFIKYMENIKSGRIKLPKASGENGGRGLVKLMTIHGSKGLEFPVCFVSNLATTYKRFEGRLICDPGYGIGMKRVDRRNSVISTTMNFDAAVNENSRLKESEEMRLLYVAATRAKEKLIFTAPVTESTAHTLHYGWVIDSGSVKNKLIDVQTHSGDTAADSVIAAEEEADVQVPELPGFTDYAFRKFSIVPAKVTATQVGVKSVDDFSEQGDRIDRFLRKPSFISGEGSSRLTGKKRGDAYHKVMEHLDFNAAPSDVPRILDELLAQGRISPIERESVDAEDIVRFLKSDICRRAAASGDIRREYPIFCEYEPAPGEWGVESWEGEEMPYIQGIADMFFIEDGEIVLVDYKTNRNATPAKLTEEYRGQLEIYARALSLALGRPVCEKLLYSFEIGEVVIS